MSSPPEQHEAPPDDPLLDDPQRFFVFACVFEGAFVFLAAALGWLLGYSPVETFALSGTAIVWGVAAAGPMIVGMVLIDRYPIGPFRSLKELVETLLGERFRRLAPWQFAAISLFAGIGEETFFRGFVQGWLAEQFSGPAAPWLALVAASLLFGAMHPISKTYAGICALMGVYFGLLWMLTGNLLVPIVTHAVYDFAALLYLTRERDDVPEQEA